MKTVWRPTCLAMLVFMLVEAAAYAKAPKNNAMIMVTSAENAKCRGSNENIGWVVFVYKTGNPSRLYRRYVSSLDIDTSGPVEVCTMIPITAPVGTDITVSGIMVSRPSIDNLAPKVSDTPIVPDGGRFNTEAFSVGLVEAQNDPYNPQDPMNIINSQGYGLLWSESEATEGAERPAVYTVVGCKGKNCPVSKTSFNTNTGSGSNKGCQVGTAAADHTNHVERSR